jgi:hypothetical protein
VFQALDNPDRPAMATRQLRDPAILKAEKPGAPFNGAPGFPS